MSPEPASLPSGADPLQGLRDAKYLNPECAESGCQWLQHVDCESHLTWVRAQRDVAEERLRETGGGSAPEEAERLLAKITPGEWRVSRQHEGSVAIYSPPPVMNLATVWGGLDDDTDHGPTSLANAEFIAAAPRLLRALLAECVTLRAERDELHKSVIYWQDAHTFAQEAKRQAEAERDRLKAERDELKRKSVVDDLAFASANHLAVEAEAASQSLVERVRGLEEALKQARDFYVGRAKYDHSEDHAIDFDGPKEDCPDCQRQSAWIAKWDALLSSVSEQEASYTCDKSQSEMLAAEQKEER